MPTTAPIVTAGEVFGLIARSASPLLARGPGVPEAAVGAAVADASGARGFVEPISS